ncbi:MAG TPA: hypothetical protein VMU16_15410 [Candidatus Binataceae bacterium]|nr:hypothetical protein [Candidatus Binataceae bacterium]
MFHRVNSAALIALAIAASGTPVWAQYGAIVPGARQTVISATAGTAGAAVSATTPAGSGKTTRLWNFTITCTPASGIVAGQVTVTDGTWSTAYQLVETTAGAKLQEQLPPVDASASNTAIAINVPAISNGGVCSIAAAYSQQT